MHISFNCIKEEKAGEKWKALFDRTWPHYQRWFVSEGYKARPGYLTSVTALEEHMPELMPIYHALLKLAGDGDLEARFLSMYCPPAYMSGCTQVAFTQSDAVSLIRNYDYSLKLFEGTMQYTNWLQPVIGVSDSMWGLLDGMNAAGLAMSLTFGGRKIVGEGFGIPLILRYILETATNVKDAVAKLLRLPVHMSYNVTLLDTSGNYTTVYLSPDRPAVVVDTPVATNHQETVEWADYATMTQTIERKVFIEELLAKGEETQQSLVRSFLQPPLYNTNFDKNFGTLYTIAYNLKKGEIKILWPNKSVKQSFEHFTEERIIIPTTAVNRKLTH